MTDAFIILGLTTTAHVVLGVAVWRTQPEGPAHRAFALLSLTLAAWTLSNGLVNAFAASPWGIVWARTAFASASLLPLWCFRFVMAFPVPTPGASQRLHRAMTGLALASCASSLTPLVAHATSSVGGVLHVTYGPLHPVFGAYFIGTLTCSLVLLGRKLRFHTGIERVQIRYVLLGIGLTATGGSVTNLLIPLVFRTSRFSVYGPLFGVLLVTLVAHAIVRYRLLNIRLVVRRGVTEVGVFAVAGAAFFVLALGASWFLALEPWALPLGVTLVLALLVAQLFRPLRRWMQSLVDYYFFRAPYNYPGALREISRAMGDIVELPALFEYTCHAIGSAVHAERVALYVRDAGSPDYRLEACWGDEGPPLPGTIFEPSLEVQRIGREAPRSLTTADFIRLADGDSPAARNDLRRLGAECFLPVLGQGQLRGFFLVGPKRSADPYFAEDIDLLSAVASQVGIAVRLHVQVGLAEAEKRRAERLASIGALASGLAHEIKNPLVAVKAFAELLPERAGDEEFRCEFAQIVLREIERIDQLVARLRGLATAPSGRFLPVDLHELLHDTLGLLRGQVERAQVRVTLSDERSVPPIFGEPTQLRQLFLNVLMNALEAMDHGGELSIRLAHLVYRHRLILEIEDTGPGAPGELLPRIFEPFVTTKPQGSGLGLAICRAIADAHHASIRAENNPTGRGMKVVMEFPILEPAAAEPAADHGRSLS